MSAEKKKALRRVGRLTEKARSAQIERDSAIREVLEISSVREVASATSLSPARIHQIGHGR